MIDFSDMKINLDSIYYFENKIFFMDSHNELFEIKDDFENIIKNIQSSIRFKDNSYLENIKLNEEELLKYLNDLIARGVIVIKSKQNFNLLSNKKIGFIGNQTINNNTINYLSATEKAECKLLNSEAPDISGLDLLIATSVAEVSEFYKKINTLSQNHKIPWLRVLLKNEQIVIGPLFVPFSTCCYNCYETRKISNQDDVEGYINYLKIFDSIYDEYSKRIKIKKHVLNLVTSLITNEMLKFFNLTSTCYGNEYVININNLEVVNHKILKLPDCYCDSLL